MYEYMHEVNIDMRHYVLFENYGLFNVLKFERKWEWDKEGKQ